MNNDNFSVSNFFHLNCNIFYKFQQRGKKKRKLKKRGLWSD